MSASLAGSQPFWHPIATEQYSSPWPHQPCDEQQCPLPHVVCPSLLPPKMLSFGKSRPQRPSERMPNHNHGSAGQRRGWRCVSVRDGNVRRDEKTSTRPRLRAGRHGPMRLRIGWAWCGRRIESRQGSTTPNERGAGLPVPPGLREREGVRVRACVGGHRAPGRTASTPTRTSSRRPRRRGGAVRGPRRTGARYRRGIHGGCRRRSSCPTAARAPRSSR